MATILWLDDYAGKSSEKRMGFDALIYFVEQKGHQVKTAPTLKQIESALAKIHSYDLLILDMIMDTMPSTTNDYQYTGLIILKRLAESSIKIPTIILSVMPSTTIKSEAKSLNLRLDKIGVKKIMRKGSVLPSELAEVVEKILSK